MQIGPLDRMQCVFWLCHLENMRTDIDVQCPIEISIQVESARFEDRSLPVQGSIRVVRGRSGCDPIALGKDAIHARPLGHRRDFTISC